MNSILYNFFSRKIKDKTMCGITGSVGKPKKKILSYNLHTNLLRETNRRGKHATGYYSVSLDNTILHDKAPISSDQYVKTNEWKKTIDGNTALIGHARFTTNGAAEVIKNNHPHLSKNGNIALVHNGIIYNYDELKTKYADKLETECDSEIIIRIIEEKETVLEGIKYAYELLGSGGDFACEVIEFDPETNKTKFYFFRDDGRPGKMIDARESLGQIFFCSEEEIWKCAVHKSGMPRTVRQLKVEDVEEYKILIIDADTLEIEEVKVDKPKYKTRFSYVNNYRSSGTNYTNYSNYKSNYKSNYNTNYNNNLQASNYNYLNPNGIDNSNLILDDNWIETVNEYGLPRFTYYPEKEQSEVINSEDLINFDGHSLTKIPKQDQDPAMRELIEQALFCRDMRYPGWQDDAYEYGLISALEWETFTLEEDEEYNQNTYYDESNESDPFEVYQNSDEEMLRRIALTDIDDDFYD